MSVSVWQELAATPTQATHDVAVIGAGLVGSTVAGLLVQAGRDVALVESRFPAAGASGCNAGFVLLGMRHRYHEAIERWGRDVAREIWTLTDENVRRMRRQVERLGVQHEECGSSFLAVDGQEAAELRQAATLLQQDGFAVEFLDHDPLERGFHAAILQPGDFSIQPAELGQALARDSGATLYAQSEVFAIQREGPNLLVRSRQALIRCRQVVLATNAYAGQLHPFFGDYMRSMRNQVLLTEPLPKILDSMGYAEHGYFYFRQLPDGRVLIGGGRHRFEAQEYTYENSVTAPLQHLIATWLAEYFPETRAVGVSRRWAGNDGLTLDGLPLVGRLPDEPEVYFAVGFSGHGNSMGLVAAGRAAELALRGTSPGVFDARRLA